MEEQLCKTELTIVVVSDIHMNVANLIELKNDLRSRGTLCHFAICAGDLLNVPHEPPQGKTAMWASEGDASTVLTHLHDLAAHVLYIPGNHDTESMMSLDYGKLPQLTTRSVNIHGSVHRIAQGLCVAGLGGAVPSFQSGHILWPGRPWATDTDPVYVNALRHITTVPGPCHDNALCDELTTDDVILLVTHSGPADSRTTLDPERGEMVYGGSTALRDLCTARANVKYGGSLNRILVNIHGHTHPGQGIDNIGATRVLNPGPLRDGQYAVLTLRKDEESARWKVASSHEYTLQNPKPWKE